MDRRLLAGLLLSLLLLCVCVPFVLSRSGSRRLGRRRLRGRGGLLSRRRASLSSVSFHFIYIEKEVRYCEVARVDGLVSEKETELAGMEKRHVHQSGTSTFVLAQSCIPSHSTN